MHQKKHGGQKQLFEKASHRHDPNHATQLQNKKHLSKPKQKQVLLSKVHMVHDQLPHAEEINEDSADENGQDLR